MRRTPVPAPVPGGVDGARNTVEGPLRRPEFAAQPTR